MFSLRRYTVIPRLPPSLEPLRELSLNLWWAWSPLARELFVRIDPALWGEVHGNPIELLSRVDQARLETLAKDEAFVAHLKSTVAMFRESIAPEGWFSKRFPKMAGAKIAYFSMEYGLHESLPIYSGGLGVLAGDHLKTASDLGLPLVGIGLAYAEGYFRQVLNPEGWQGESYPINDWRKLPVRPVRAPNASSDNDRLIIDVQYPKHVVHAQLWRVDVGRVPLYLLDANLEQNSPDDRAITGPLYGGDHEFRVRQEIMLGIGGMHALDALGLSPTICHMNEGHSAFLAIERIARIMRERNVPFHVAAEACSACNIFTTHTPVPAGNDAFDPALVRQYLEPYRAALGISEGDLLALGRVDPEDKFEPFSMPVLALHTSDHFNGVSELHGDVSRKMWSGLWPNLPTHEVPIQSITNGVHIPSFISDELGALFNRYLGRTWAESTDDPAIWERAYSIPDAELWEAHELRRHRLVTLVRSWHARHAERHGAVNAEFELGDEILNPRVLTIGFARRFATYKRATLLFSDLDRVAKLLGNKERPVQLIFAGKAHPKDTGGKELIRAIVRASREINLRGRVVFVENYDMSIARALVSGVDVWLNTPRRPLEASGTSGMKAAANGALNVSVLDGWFAEAWRDYGDSIGWAIGRGEQYDDGEGDKVEADLLYDLLEREVVPLFYHREDRDDIPHAWVKRMKNAIAKLAPRYNTMRMVREYTERFYVPSIELSRAMFDNNLAGARALTAWKERVQKAWPHVRIRDVTVSSPTDILVGEPVRVEAIVELGDLEPSDIAVELYFGATGGGHGLSNGTTMQMTWVDRAPDVPDAPNAIAGSQRYRGEIPTHESGAHAFAVRAIPRNSALTHRFETSLIRWG